MAEDSQFPGAVAPGKTAIIHSIFDFSSEALDQLKLWLEQNPPMIPVTQLPGFLNFTAQAATTINTEESTASTSYTNLSTVGPTITNLPDGKYLLLYGAYQTSSTTGYYSPKVNSTEAVDANAATPDPKTALGEVVFYELATLSAGGNNTVTMRYRTASGTSSWARRWLVCFRYGNL